MRKRRLFGALAVVAIVSGLLPIAFTASAASLQSLAFGSGYAAAAGADATTAEAFWGDGSWQETYPSGKTDLYIDPVTQFGGSFTVDEIQSISYHTLSNTPLVDFYLAIYTEPGGVDCNGSWYCQRLNAEPYFSNGYVPSLGSWVEWDTDAGANQLTFFDSNACGSFGFYGSPTLADLQAGPIDWSSYGAGNCPGPGTTVDYGDDTVKYLSLQTGSGWAAFDGYLDAITIELTNGDVFEIDLEDTPAEVWVDDDWAGSAPGVEVAPGRFFGHDAFATVQSGVDGVLAGGTVHVLAGGYLENISLTKPLELLGAGAGNPVAGRTFGAAAEAMIMGAMTIDADGVAVDGFSMTNPSGTRVVLVQQHSSDVEIANNLIEGVGTLSSNQNVHAIYLNDGPDDVRVIGNSLSALAADGRSVSAISVLDSTGNDCSDDVVIADNVISGVTSLGPIRAWGTYGIIANHCTTDLQITGNTIEGLSGLWAHGIGLEGDAPGVTVAYNTVRDLTDQKSPSDAIAVFFEANPSYGSAAVNFNAFEDVNVGVAVHPALLGGGTVDAACNWWDDAFGPSGLGSGSGAAVGPDVAFEPWLGSPDLDGHCVGGTPLGLKGASVDALAGLLPTGNDKDDKRIEKAIERLEKSLTAEWWLSPSTLDPKDGKKVFDEEKKAVSELTKVDDTDVSAIIGAILSADEQLAATALADAQAAVVGAPGDTAKAEKELAKAEKELAKAADEIAAGDLDKAVEKYRKAWEHAGKAIDKL
jgi:hypothetical protein